MTRADKWKKRPCVLRYRAFKDELRLRLKVLPVPLHIEFLIEMPRSWSMRKKTESVGTNHTQKPDIDNLLKAVMDAMLEDDSGVYEVHAVKRWSWKDAIILHEKL